MPHYVAVLYDPATDTDHTAPIAAASPEAPWREARRLVRGTGWRLRRLVGQSGHILIDDSGDSGTARPGHPSKT